MWFAIKPTVHACHVGDLRKSGMSGYRNLQRSSTEIAIAMDLDPQFMESEDYTKLASGYEKALADVHKDFAAAQYLVDEEFQMEQAHMQNDFDDAVEKLEQEFRLAKVQRQFASFSLHCINIFAGNLCES